MTQEELDALAAQHGGVSGSTKLDPEINQLVPDQAHNPGVTVKVPNPNPKFTIVFGDNTHVTLHGREGSPTGQADSVYDVLPGSTALNPPKAGTTKAPVKASVTGISKNDPYYVVENPDGTITVNKNEGFDSSTKEVKPTVVKTRGGWVALDQDGTVLSQGTDEAQADVDRQNAASKQADQGLRQQQIDLNASLAGAKTKLDAAEARWKDAQIEWGNSKADDASAKAKFDQAAKQHDMDNADAVFEYNQKKDALAQATKDRDQTRKEALDASNALIKNRQADITEAHNKSRDEETARSNKATEGINSGIASNTAANNTLSRLNEGAATGGTFLGNRVTAAKGIVSDLESAIGTNKNIGLGSGLGANFASNLVNGAGAWVTDLGGGQANYDAAGSMLRAADPNSAQAAPAYATLQQNASTLQQMMQGYQQTFGEPHSADPGTGQQQPGQQQPAVQQPGLVTPQPDWQRADQPLTGNGPALPGAGVTGTVLANDDRYLGTKPVYIPSILAPVAPSAPQFVPPAFAQSGLSEGRGR